ncbi:MAG: hypothetical protein ACR2PL_25710 [Dehalococcoidia bacterium]
MREIDKATVTVKRDLYLNLIETLRDYAELLESDAVDLQPAYYERPIDDDISFDEYAHAVGNALPIAEVALKKRLCILMRDGEVGEVVEMLGETKVRKLQGGGIDYLVDELVPADDADHDSKVDRKE